MKKIITKKQEREVTMEDLNSNIKIVLEYVAQTAKRQPKIDKMAEDMEEMKQSLQVLTVGHTYLVEKTDAIQKDLNEIYFRPRYLVALGQSDRKS